MTPRDRQIHELHCRLEDAEAHLAELERENYGIPDRAVEAQEHKIQTIEDRLDTLNRKENRLMIRSGLLVAVLLCLVAIVTPQAYAATAAPVNPAAPGFSSSGSLSVNYGCGAAAMISIGVLNAGLSGGYSYVGDIWATRRSAQWLRCDTTLIARNPGHGCTDTIEIAGLDGAISGWKMTAARCW